MTTRARTYLGAVALLSLALGACGSDSDSESSADATTVIVANGNADNGSAGRMTDALRLAGFSTGEPTSSQTKVDASIVYYSSDDGADQVAEEVADVLGGVDVLPLPDPAPTDSGEVEGGGVLVLLGQNEADKTLEELSGGGATTTTTAGAGGTTLPAVGGTVKCDKASISKALEGIDGLVGIEDFACADGWAYALVDTDGYTETVVLEAEGQFWILKDRNDVCGTGPDDAEVPSSIWEPACNTN